MAAGDSVGAFVDFQLDTVPACASPPPPAAVDVRSFGGGSGHFATAAAAMDTIPACAPPPIPTRSCMGGGGDSQRVQLTTLPLGVKLGGRAFH